MKVSALDSNGDWTFGSGLNNYVSGNDAVAELIDTRLLCFLGDCFFDAGAGINWFGYLGGKDQLSLNLAVSACILNTQDSFGNQVVTGLQQLSINLNHNTRALSISYVVSTLFSGGTSSSISRLLTETGAVIDTEAGSPIILE